MARKFRLPKTPIGELMAEKGMNMFTLAQRSGLSYSAVKDALLFPKPRQRQTNVYFAIGKVLGISEYEAREMSGNPLINEHPLIALIGEKGMTIREFCYKTDFPYETIVGIVSGRVKNPRAGTMYMLADLLNVDVEHLTRRIENA